VIFDESRQRVPIRSWAADATAETVRQLQRIASRADVVDAVAAMPDAHVASGVAVGTVFATEDAVVPGALGGDLGCGMSAHPLALTAADLDRGALVRAVAALDRAIPSGMHVHRGRGVAVPDALFEAPLSTAALERTRAALTKKHLATLGGGNHFVEIDRDADGGVWLLVHSGSRGLGAAIAAHHARAAPGDLGALDAREGAGAAYLSDLAWALHLARENRAALAARALGVLSETLGRDVALAAAPGSLDVCHNFVARERWGDRDLLVHRKGAVAAPLGSRALVPGSMATASYVVRGLGNPAAFGSCSHGAGRVLSRREAREAIDRRAFEAAMRRVVFPAGRGPALVEEAPAAYRDIGAVLDAQRDLVARELRLEPLAVLKG